MKKPLFLLFILISGFSLKSVGQAKVERYCVIHATDHSKEYVNIKKISIDYGQFESTPIIKDSTEIKSIVRAHACKSEAGILAYMSSIGWTWVSTRQPFAMDDIIITFKKTFEKSRL